MRPIYGCPEKFRESWLETATFPKICNGLLFRLILRMYVQNWKFVALPVPEIIGVLKNFRQSLDTPTLPFLPIFKGLLFAWTLWIHLPNLKFVALPVPEIIGGTQKNWAVPFLPDFCGAFVRMDPVNIPAKFEVRSFTRSEIIGGTPKIWPVPGYACTLPFLPNF